ncbi:MAG: gamma-glutamyltransferase, partial [Bacteroidota bacterium]
HTDIQLNNMLGEAALLPKGYHTWLPNQRLSSMMAPSMVFDAQQQLEITLGSGGAGRIATAITQVLHLLLDHQLPLAEAVQAPRVHLEKDVFNMEYGFAAYPSPQQLDRPGNAWKEQSLYFGGVHTVARHGNGWAAVGDQRRDGVARS